MELLSHREQVASDILKSVDPVTDKWGIDVDKVELKDIELPGNMVRTMAKQAEGLSEREERQLLTLRVKWWQLRI